MATSIKKISELEKINALSASSNVIIEENGKAKRFNANNIGKVKTVNGIEPDANGNIEIDIDIPEVEIPEINYPVTSVNGMTGDVVIEIGNGNGGTSSVQFDWSQNDETASDYVKNRTHYVEEEGWEVTWDGNTESVETVVTIMDMNFYHVSDVTPTNDELQKSVITICQSDGIKTYERQMNASEIWDDCMDFIIDDYAVLDAIIVVRTENAVIADVTFPKVGVYFCCAMMDEYKQYVSKLGDPEVVKKLDAKFLPDEIVGKWGTGLCAEVFNRYPGMEHYGNIEPNTAYGDYSHAEGSGTIAGGNGAHAEGIVTEAIGGAAHSEGINTKAEGDYAHAEGSFTTASGAHSHAEGSGTIAAGKSQHVQGRYNIEDGEGKYAHIVGNGKELYPSNAHTLDWAGNAWYAGTVESKAVILVSSVKGSTKRFKITVNDSGELSATKIIE